MRRSRSVDFSCAGRAGLGLALWIALSASVSAADAPVPLPPAPPRPGEESGPTRIAVDAWFADVTKIDSAAQSLSANLVLVLSWHDPTLAHRDAQTRTHALEDVWHPRWLVANEGESLQRSLPEIVDVAPDGTVLYRQRLLGSFTQALDLRRFPFDHETFQVHLVLSGQRPEDVEFVPDPSAVADGMPQGVGIADSLTLQDWRVTGVSARPQPYRVGRQVELAGYAIELTASRRAGHYLLGVILPLLLIVSMSWVVFWLDPTLSDSQLNVAITAILTLIAFRFAVGIDVPGLPYLTLLDSFILASTLLVFASLFEVVATTSLALRGQVDAARRVDRHARWIFPSLFALVVAAIFWA